MSLIIFLILGITIIYFIDKILKYLTTLRCPKCGKKLLVRYFLHKTPTPVEDGIEEKILYCECGYERKIEYSVPYWKIIRKEGFRGFEVIPWTDLYKDRKEEVVQTTAESERDSEESPNTRGQGAG